MSTSPKTPKKAAKPKAVAAPKVRKQKPASGSARQSKAASAAARQATRVDATGHGAEVLDRLWAVVQARRDADPASSHSARLLGRGTAKVAQKFGEEAVECLIEAVAGNRGALVAESADVLYHLLVLWVDAGVRPDEVWGELVRREGVSGIAEKAARPRIETRKIP